MGMDNAKPYLADRLIWVKSAGKRRKRAILRWCWACRKLAAHRLIKKFHHDATDTVGEDDASDLGEVCFECAKRLKIKTPRRVNECAVVADPDESNSLQNKTPAGCIVESDFNEAADAFGGGRDFAGSITSELISEMPFTKEEIAAVLNRKYAPPGKHYNSRLELRDGPDPNRRQHRKKVEPEPVAAKDLNDLTWEDIWGEGLQTEEERLDQLEFQMKEWVAQRQS